MNAILVFVIANQRLAPTPWAVLYALVELDSNLETRHFVKVDYHNLFFDRSVGQM